jgi:hypothetical protein
MFRLVFLLGVFTTLVACGLDHNRVYTKSYKKDFKVLKINQPKHFSVTLLDMSNHVLFEHVGNSKHCNNWNNVGKPSLHDTISVSVHEYYYTDDPKKIMYYEPNDTDVNNIFCR